MRYIYQLIFAVYLHENHLQHFIPHAFDERSHEYHTSWSANKLTNGLLMKAVRQNVCINVWTTLLLWKDKTARWCRAHYWKTHKTKTDKPMKDQHETNSNDITVPIQQNLYSASKLFLSCYLSKLFLINGSMCLSLCVCGPLLCLDATEIARAIQNDVSHFLFEI